MSKEEISRTLELLRAELERLDAGNAPVRTRIAALIRDIERQLDASDEFDDGQSIFDRLAGILEDFEADHPRITGIVSKLSTTLSNMGI